MLHLYQFGFLQPIWIVVGIVWRGHIPASEWDHTLDLDPQEIISDVLEDLPSRSQSATVIWLASLKLQNASSSISGYVRNTGEVQPGRRWTLSAAAVVSNVPLGAR